MSRPFDNYRNMALGGGDPAGFVDWLSDDIMASLIDLSIDPIPDTSLMVVRSELVGVTSEVLLTGITVGDVGPGTLDSENPVFLNVTGNQVEWVVLWKDTGDEETSPLLYLLDTFASGTPIPSTGEDAEVRWTDNGIFTLGSLA